MNFEKSIVAPIVFTATRLESIADRYVFAPMKMSSSSVKILRYVIRSGKTTPKRILEFVGGTKSNVSQRLDFLQKEGLIKRQYGENGDDRREVCVEVTKNGEERIREIEKRFEKAQLCLENNFTKEEIDQYRAFFKKLNGFLDCEEEVLRKLFHK